MFKKFKDKLAEEMKQSPSRLQAGMQQLAQAVISPAASGNHIPDITTSVDDLNLTSEEAETLQSSSTMNQFQNIDLQASNSMERSRRSSFSSVTSDSFFPTYESPGNIYHMQSDMEQSASEFEDSSSSQLEHITKDELYNAYQKLRTKYTKYRAVYREVLKENTKMKSVLVETQDKALRRIANLKEQCQLEQDAKAHLEEALRNDIEEKDHLITTLNTKIKLLQVHQPESISASESNGKNDNSGIDQFVDSTNKDFDGKSDLLAENAVYKERIKKFENLLAKCNESLKRNKEKITQLTENRDILERDLNILKKSTVERTELLESEIYNAKREIMSLNEQISVFKKREEDSALSLAENKLFIHRELDVKEEQNKQIQKDLKKTTEHNNILAEVVAQYDHEFKQFNVIMSDRSVEPDKKISQLQNLFTNKSEALKLIHQDIEHKFVNANEEMVAKQGSKVDQNQESSSSIHTGKNESSIKNEEISRSRDELEIQNAQLLGLTTELKSCKSTITDLKEMLRDVTIEWEQATRDKKNLTTNILNYKEIIGKLRCDCNSLMDQVKQNHSDHKSTIVLMNKKMSDILNRSHTKVDKAVGSPANSICGDGDESQVMKENLSRNTDDSDVELKSIINENNALKKKCQDLMEQNNDMINKVHEFDVINSKNIKLIAEIDRLNFKLQDLAQLHEIQDKLQSEMEGLKEKLPFGDTVEHNSKHFTNEVSSLKEKLSNYDSLLKDNTILKQELVDLKNQLAQVMGSMASFKSEQVENMDVSVRNFSEKCADYENMIVNLTGKFSEQTKQLENLYSELGIQKSNFNELNEKYKARNLEFEEANKALEKKGLEFEALNEKCNKQYSEIEDLKGKGAEILKQLDETAKVRQEMIDKFNQLEFSKNNIIISKTKELEELRLEHEAALRELNSSNEMKNESIILKSNEIQVLTNDNVELADEIERLKAKISDMEKLKGSNSALQMELEALRIDSAELEKKNAELKKTENHLLEQNTGLKDSILKSQTEFDLIKKKLDMERCNIEKRCQELCSELETAKEKIAQAEAGSGQLCKKIEILEKRESEQSVLQGELDAKNKILANEVSVLQTEVEALKNVQQTNVDLVKEIVDLKSKIQTLTGVEVKNVELQTCVESLNHKIITLEGLEMEIHSLTSENERLKVIVAEIEILKSEHTALRRELEISDQSRAEYLAEISNLRDENTKLALQLEEMQISLDQKDHSDYVEALEKKDQEISKLQRTAQDSYIEFKTKTEELIDQREKLISQHADSLEVNIKKIADLEILAEDLKIKLAKQTEVANAFETMNMQLRDQDQKTNSERKNNLAEKEKRIIELKDLAEDLEKQLAELRGEVDACRTTNKELRDEIVAINWKHSNMMDVKTSAITELEKVSRDLEEKLVNRIEEIHALDAANKDLQVRLETVSQNAISEQDLMMSYQKSQDQNKELRTHLDEAVFLQEAKQSQIEILSQELKQQADNLNDKLKTNEEEQSMRIKQLVKEFQAQIHDKDEQIQAALEKRFERQQNYESELIQQYKEQLKDFQVELTAKSEQIENLILSNKDTIQSYNDHIQELTQTIAQIKKEHVNELQETEQNWKTILKQRTDQLETKHADEVNELTKEWWSERKELEGTSRVAMATIQSNTGSLHSLQQTLISQKRELSELRKLLRIRNDNLEGSTEIEYLKNILFEYMMGRETLVLSRVISAVVKFDQEQTSKVLKKEEDKLTLLGSLGLL
ncbi:golgin subfamily A member 4 isoform X2 [Athalia rosae]|uniref:golgin subfamily A member 4 isoform X2 n=1 Tax=Athalia rosae TaxID=37344 RepID=UPI002033A521|nr:golgin subfamily A member 4 isoform X2 [Athalia rosae]